MLSSEYNVVVNVDYDALLVLTKMINPPAQYLCRFKNDYSFITNGKTFFIENNEIHFLGNVYKLVLFSAINEKYIGYSEDKHIAISLMRSTNNSSYRDLDGYFYRTFSCEIYSTDYNLGLLESEKLANYYKQNYSSNTDYYPYWEHGILGYSTGLHKYISWDLIKNNYLNETQEQYNNLISAFENNNTGGNIIILTGAPGTGKSMFSKALASKLSNIGYSIVMASSNRSFDVPETTMGNGKGNVFIFDDNNWVVSGAVDEEIRSYLLSTSSSPRHNNYFIFITNAKQGLIDKAFTRPGRCAACIEFTEIPKERFNKIIESISESNKTIDKKALSKLLKKDSLTLAEIYAIANNQNVQNNLTTNEPTLRRIQHVT